MSLLPSTLRYISTNSAILNVQRIGKEMVEIKRSQNLFQIQPENCVVERYCRAQSIWSLLKRTYLFQVLQMF